jgi:hypothetical protein
MAQSAVFFTQLRSICMKPSSMPHIGCYVPDVLAFFVCMQRALDHLVALLANGSLALLRHSHLLNR